MICAWESLVQILPAWLRLQIREPYPDVLQEIRLRLQAPPELVCSDGVRRLDKPVSGGDIGFCIQAASRYSPWASESMTSRGYITAPGGHRIGICGEAVFKNGVFSLFQKVSNERQRSVLIDFYINNQTLEQISENLNLSVSSVKRLKKKGLKTAKAVYERGNNKA